MTGNTRIISIFAITTLITCLSIAASAQELEKPLDAVINFSDRSFNFGFLPKGVHALHTYVIENKGTDTLRIIKVSPTCGCTSAPLGKSDIGPGDSTNLDVFFDSKKFSGKVTKKISILSNDPKDPYTDISFSAQVDRVHPFITAKPIVIETEQKNASAYNVKLTNTGTDPLEIRIVSSSEPYIEARLSREKIEAGTSVDLIVKIKKRYEAFQETWYSVTLETNDPQKYRLTIPMHVPQ
jgi:hypothetical protein